jgi:hypothetical protein
MNERLKELELEAAYGNIDPNGPFTAEEFNQFTAKFAELIVEECRIVVAQVFRKNPIELCGPLAEADDEIARHFGVEE